MDQTTVFGGGFRQDSLANATLSGAGIQTGDSEEGGEVIPLDPSEVVINANGRIADPIKAVSGSIDLRVKFLSHSSSLTLHACPRKYQLYKLRAKKATIEESASVTFAFGHVIGEGIQQVFRGVPYRRILFDMFRMWNVPLNARAEKHKKSFSEAVFAVRKFAALRTAGFLNEYELVYIPNPETGNDEPACELGFAVSIFDGFQYRGFVDAVLRNKLTGEIIILECKTTWHRESNPAKFKNSGQALGYSVVLDSLFPGLSSYSVLYLVYSSTTLEFTTLPFPKSFESRAEWIRTLVFDTEDIIRYEEAGIYPRRGESCFDFGQPCEYIETCGMSTTYLARPLEESAEQIEKDEARYTHRFNLVDLINNQVSRNTKILEGTNG